ncbi:MAG: FAD-dependent monooxygenase, partial [Propionibacteriales bacterium]|nr:FAD-dependent monooxygenase [Propionibacteriales bacterium]
MDIIVIGGGVGGLATANALARDGHAVHLFERSAGFEPVGAGLVLAANAVRVLDSLGVSLAGEGQELRLMEMRAKDGSLLSALSTAQLATQHGPSYGISRARAHELLTRALPGSVEVTLGVPVEAIAERQGRVWVSASTGEYSADAVVAADGIRSAVRAQLPTGPGRLRYSGTTCWRGMIDYDAGEVATEAWGGRTRVGVVPIAPRRAYYYLVADAAAGLPGPANLADFISLFAGYGGVAGEVISLLDAVPPLHHDLFELDRPVWGSGRVLLLGDAAHSMTPNQGQGAVMAIEDAKAAMLALRQGAEGALERYTTMRHQRVRKVQLDSRRIGQVAHWHHPVAMAVRNAALRLTPAPAADRVL